MSGVPVEVPFDECIVKFLWLDDRDLEVTEIVLASTLDPRELGHILPAYEAALGLSADDEGHVTGGGFKIISGNDVGDSDSGSGSDSGAGSGGAAGIS